MVLGGFVTKVRLWVGCVIWWSMLQSDCFVSSKVIVSNFSLTMRTLANALTIFEYSLMKRLAPRRAIYHTVGQKKRPTDRAAGQELKQTKRSLACFVSIANYIN